MAVKFSNNASGTIASSINSTTTTIVLTSGQGSLFPSLGATDFFYATLIDSSNNLEIVKVTARSTDTMTVVRGQDGTSGRSYTAGDRFELRPVAAAMNALQDFTPVGGISATTIAGAIEELDTEKAPLASPALTGVPTAPTASAGTNTTQLATTAFVISNGVPTGGILLWSGSVASIPSGWALCDGTSGTPDLRDRFVVGAGSTYAVDATGGSTTTTATGTISGSVAGTSLTEAQMPKHFHSLRGANGPFTSTVPSATASGSGNYGGGTPDDGTAGYGTNSVGGSAASGSSSTGTGNGDSHTHGFSATFSGNAVTSLPPYYALAYIMKL